MYLSGHGGRCGQDLDDERCRESVATSERALYRAGRNDLFIHVHPCLSDCSAAEDATAVWVRTRLTLAV
jgi:hypothetical protein